MADIRNTPMLDDFERADESPLAGNWATSGLTGDMALEGGNATHAVGGESGDAYWTPQAYSGNVEVWGIAEGGQGAGMAWALDLWQSPGGSGIDGYRGRQELAAATYFLRIYRVDNGSGTVIADTFPDDGFTQGSADTLLLLRRIDASNTLQLWYVQPSEGGAGGTWTKALEVVDSTYTGSFYLGCGIFDGSGGQQLGWEAIGGGADDWMPEFIRRPWEHHGGHLNL